MLDFSAAVFDFFGFRCVVVVFFVAVLFFVGCFLLFVEVDPEPSLGQFDEVLEVLLFLFFCLVFVISSCTKSISVLHVSELGFVFSKSTAVCLVDFSVKTTLENSLNIPVNANASPFIATSSIGWTRSPKTNFLKLSVSGRILVALVLLRLFGM